MCNHDWLLDEPELIRAKKFHILGKRPKRMRFCSDAKADLQCFLERFGRARLYRSGLGYRIVIYPPRRTAYTRMLGRGGRLAECGGMGGRTLVTDDADGPKNLWLVPSGRVALYPVRGSFADLLRREAAKARKHYDPDEWRMMAADPPPFTPMEREIIEARKLFSWRFLGAKRTASGTLMDHFHVRNGSSRTLPCLGIGKRGPRIEGRVFLGTGDIPPGSAKRVVALPHVGEKYEYFSLPDPRPEERDIYWELRDA
jgi:hypothetical protein